MKRYPLAAIARGDQSGWTIEHCELAPPRAGELRLRVLSCGICATDIKAAAGAYGTPLPAVLGHETVGEVLDVGPGVKRLSPGDRVLVSYGFCGACAACAQGPPIYCAHSFELNVLGRRLDGTAPMRWHDRELTSHFFGQSGFATEAIVREACAIPVPRDLDATLLAPLACGVLTGGGIVANLLTDRIGGLLVAGCGTVGLSVIALAKAAGRGPVIAIDRIDNRLEAARRAGADDAWSTESGDLEQTLRRFGPQPDVVDTTGATSIIEALQTAIAPRGQLILAGIDARVAEFDLRRLVLGGRTIRGTAEGEADPRRLVPWLIDAIRDGRLPIDDWVRAYPFAEISRAAADLTAGRVIKPVLRMPPLSNGDNT